MEIYVFNWLTLSGLCIACGVVGCLVALAAISVATHRSRRRAERARAEAWKRDAEVAQADSLARLAARGGRLGTSNVVELRRGERGGAA